ncbi:DUF6168 family protein [Hyunsoonleella sp. 2307UL5-6]|uniref:DUF6168 family protein n=1 Tax=Hyunsoonleella sp. 2307UL5-6 TaxID=3384768 RepID=UPI0039BD6C15
MVSFVLLFLLSYGLHTTLLTSNNRFNLFDVYLYFAACSFLLCIVFNILSKIKNTSQQLGFLYLFTLVIKVGIFALLFKNSILALSNLTKIERLNMLIPLFVFLFLEIFFISRLLMDKKTTSII